MDEKVAAAMAAVNRYLEMESVEFASPSEDFGGATLRQGTANRANIWGISGRQDQMQLRRMMQLRSFK